MLDHYQYSLRAQVFREGFPGPLRSRYADNAALAVVLLAQLESPNSEQVDNVTIGRREVGRWEATDRRALIRDSETTPPPGEEAAFEQYRLRYSVVHHGIPGPTRTRFADYAALAVVLLARIESFDAEQIVDLSISKRTVGPWRVIDRATLERDAAAEEVRS